MKSPLASVGSRRGPTLIRGSREIGKSATSQKEPPVRSRNPSPNVLPAPTPSLGMAVTKESKKNIFMGAAMRASTAAGPMCDFYEVLPAKGRRPTMARLTLARKIAAITMIAWNKGARFDAKYLKQAA